MKLFNFEIGVRHHTLLVVVDDVEQKCYLYRSTERSTLKLEDPFLEYAIDDDINRIRNK